MPYTIQIEPLTTKLNNNNIITETKRQSLYTRIRYASKLIKLCPTDIRKHKTLPTNFVMLTPQSSTKKSSSSNYCYEEEDEDAVTIFDEKDVLITNTTKDKGCTVYGDNDSQLVLPSRLKYFSPCDHDDQSPPSPPTYLHHHDKDDEKEEKDKTEVYEDEEYSEDEEEEDDDNDLDNYMMETSIYTATLQKLSGISFANNNKHTAVLITLSPCALAAANAARQKRQKIRINSSNR